MKEHRNTNSKLVGAPMSSFFSGRFFPFLSFFLLNILVNDSTRVAVFFCPAAPTTMQSITRRLHKQTSLVCEVLRKDCERCTTWQKKIFCECEITKCTSWHVFVQNLETINVDDGFHNKLSTSDIKVNIKLPRF